MSKPLPDDIIKATRLTQDGRLHEATALLQKVLGQAGASNRAADQNSRGPTAKSSLPAIDRGAEDVRAESPLQGLSALPRCISGIFERLRPLGQIEARQRALQRTPRPGVTETPNTGDFVARIFSNESGRLNYKLFIPSGHKGKPRPLIVMLHGCSQSPDDFASGTRMNIAAEAQTCFVAYPEQTTSANSSKCWNWFQSGHQNRDEGEPSLIAGIARQIMAEHKIDDRRVYIAGLSAGGAAAAVVAEAYPEIFAALGVHSGLACGAASDMQSAFAAMQGRHSGATPNGGKLTPTIVFHGDRDMIVHPKNGVDVVARAAAQGAFRHEVTEGNVPSGRAYTRSIHRNVGGLEIIEDWVIHGAGHAWSGGSPDGSYTDPLGPDATTEMLRFFLAHKRPK